MTNSQECCNGASRTNSGKFNSTPFSWYVTTFKMLDKNQEHPVVQRTERSVTIKRPLCSGVPPLCLRCQNVCWIKAGHVFRTMKKILLVHIPWHLDPPPSSPKMKKWLSFRHHQRSRMFPALILQSEYHNHNRTTWTPELLIILQCAKQGSVFAPARRKACKRWKTGPRAGWLFAPSRPTPKATENWRRGEAGKGYGGTWQNVLSACRRGEPARLWAGTDAEKGCKKQRHQKKRIKCGSKKKPSGKFPCSVFCPHVWLYTLPHLPPGYQTYKACIIPVVIGEAELWVQSGRGKEYWWAGAIRKGFVVVLMVTWKTEHS